MGPRISRIHYLEKKFRDKLHSVSQRTMFIRNLFESILTVIRQVFTLGSSSRLLTSGTKPLLLVTTAWAIRMCLFKLLICSLFIAFLHVLTWHYTFNEEHIITKVGTPFWGVTWYVCRQKVFFGFYWSLTSANSSESVWEKKGSGKKILLCILWCDSRVQLRVSRLKIMSEKISSRKLSNHLNFDSWVKALSSQELTYFRQFSSSCFFV